MSLISMTGYGHGSASSAGRTAAIEISSVNRKQLDIQVQLARPYSALEARVHKELQKSLHRGRVHVSVNIDRNTRTGSDVHVDMDLARKYVKTLKKAGKELQIDTELSVSHLLRIPDAVLRNSEEEDLDELWALVQKPLRKAVKELREMRATEGAALQKDLQIHLNRMIKAGNRMAQLAPDAADAYEKRLLGRLKQSGLKAVLDDERIVKEVALFAEKSDVSEEIKRLESHFTQVESCFTQKAPAGRTLDFLSQEILREINTVGSKCSDVRITKLVIQCKADIDRFREQVQNIE